MISSRTSRVLCVDSGGNEDLVAGKTYRTKPDAKAKASEMIRVVDESGEDYLYPAKYFTAPKR